MSNEPDFSLGGSRIDPLVDPSADPSVPPESGRASAPGALPFHEDIGQLETLSAAPIDLRDAPSPGETDENTVVERTVAQLATERS